ncbi:MAG: polymer-forming cytoskeletal protein [Ruminiclostridium sp.]|nr:polymer-forming cytoskeletal protein [Ruminiclostridium sp.]
MFNKKDSVFREGVDTLVGSNTIFTGNIESDGTVRIDGKVRGDVRVEGDIYVGEKAVVTGSLAAANVNLAGTVEGNITSKGILKILSTAKLYGDIKVNSFVADEGALFQGKCSMLEPTEAEKANEKAVLKKNYKKSSVLDDVFEEKEKNNSMKAE